MLIGQLSKLSGFSRHTIRFYEKQGMFTLGRKNRMVNNYKDYPEEVFRKLLTIKKLKGFRFTLDESSDLLALIEENQASCNTVVKKVDEKVKMIDEKIEELMRIKNMMLDGVAACTGSSGALGEGNCAMLAP